MKLDLEKITQDPSLTKVIAGVWNGDGNQRNPFNLSYIGRPPCGGDGCHGDSSMPTLSLPGRGELPLAECTQAKVESLFGGNAMLIASIMHTVRVAAEAFNITVPGTFEVKKRKAKG